MEAVLQDSFIVSVPNGESERLKGLIELMGWSISPIKTNSQGLYDPECGRYLNDETMQVIEDSNNGIGVNTYNSFDEFVHAMNAL